MPLGANVRYRTLKRGGHTIRVAYRGGSAKKKTGTLVESKDLTTGEVTRHNAREPRGQFRRKRSPARIQRDIRKGRDYRI